MIRINDFFKKNQKNHEWVVIKGSWVEYAKTLTFWYNFQQKHKQFFNRMLIYNQVKSLPE